MKAKIFILLLVVTLLLAACGSNGDRNNPGSENHCPDIKCLLARAIDNGGNHNGSVDDADLIDQAAALTAGEAQP